LPAKPGQSRPLIGRVADAASRQDRRPGGTTNG